MYERGIGEGVILRIVNTWLSVVPAYINIKSISRNVTNNNELCDKEFYLGTKLRTAITYFMLLIKIGCQYWLYS